MARVHIFFVRQRGVRENIVLYRGVVVLASSIQRMSAGGAGGGGPCGGPACCLLDTVKPYDESSWEDTGNPFRVYTHELEKRNLPWSLIQDTLSCFTLDSAVGFGGKDPVPLDLSDPDRTVTDCYQQLKELQRAYQKGVPTAVGSVTDVRLDDKEHVVENLLAVLMAAVHVQADCLYLREPQGVGQFRYLLGPVGHCALCLLRKVLDVSNPNVDRFTNTRLVNLAQWYAHQMGHVTRTLPP